MSSLTVFDHVRGLSDESGEVERSKPSDKRFKTSKKENVIKSTEIVAIVQPNPKKNKRRTELPSHITQVASTADMNSSLKDEEQRPSQPATSSQIQTTASVDSNKYTISNVLKYIYTLKYVQKSTNGSSSVPQQSNNTTAELTSSYSSQSSNQVSASSSNTSVTGSTTSPPTAKQFWMPDDQVKECYECNEKFTTFRRRHHCRVCGQIFCGKCSDHEIPSQLIFNNTTGNIRTCSFCHSFVSKMQRDADLKHNTSSIRELMRRLSLSTSSALYSNMDADNTYNAFLESMQLQQQQQQSQLLSSTSNNSTGSMSSLVVSTTVASLSNSLSSPQQQMNTGMQTVLGASSNDGELDDNNPFDVDESREYSRQHDAMEINQLIINNSSELRNLWIQIYHTSDGLTFTTRSINKFKKINNCITGRELVDWLMKKKSMSKDQAIVIGQALLHGKWLECVYQINPTAQSSYYSSKFDPSNSQTLFYDDYSFYKPGYSALNFHQIDDVFEKKKDLQDTEEGPEWIKELNKLVTSGDDDIPSQLSALSGSQAVTSADSVPSTSLPSESPSLTSVNELSQVKPDPIISEDQQDFPVPSVPNILEDILLEARSEVKEEPEAAIKHTETVKEDRSARSFDNVNDDLQQVHKQIQIELLKQLLKLKNISFDWFDVIIKLVWQSVHLVRPDVKHDSDSMDIRQYIKIKKLPAQGLTKADCRIVNGLVFSKNIAHRKMQHDIKTPKVLLLRSSIEYQRSEDKLSSLEAIHGAEAQYLRNYCSKLLLRHSPDILVVEKSVARIAQEFFLQSEVSLVLNVKSSIMDKLCRFLQADPMYSIDDLVRKPKLGFCSRFHVDSYQLTQSERHKSIMFFEGTPTNLGCTILISGASNSELAVIKSLIRFMIYVAYNSKLEQSFILDKYADFSLKNTIFEFKSDENETAEPRRISFMTAQKNNTDHLTVSRQSSTVEKKDKLDVAKPKMKEISIDESPLDQVKFKVDSDEEGSDGHHQQPELKLQVISEKDSARSKLDLKLCEQHRERNSINLTRNFKLLLDDLLLSCSPFIKHSLPYLLSESSSTDSVKKYLPNTYSNYLQSNILLMDSHSGPASPSAAMSSSSSSLDLKSDSTNHQYGLHELLSIHLTRSFDDIELKKLYADFKSRGGISTAHSFSSGFVTSSGTRRLILKHVEDVPVVPEYTGNENGLMIEKTISNKTSTSSAPVADCLDIFNRQNIAVLFFSQCESSPVYPNICQKPRVINMKFYSENDMTLGGFLAKNCFRTGYKCNNEMCNSLIVYHTRLFVHGDCKITVRMSIVPSALSSNLHTSPSSSTNNSSSKDNSSASNSSDNQQFANLSVAALSSANKSGQSNKSGASQQTPTVPPPQSHTSPQIHHDTTSSPIAQQPIYDDINIFMWSVCKICNKSTKKTPMSPDTWSYSLAKFLELTFHGKTYHQFNNNSDSHECHHSLFIDHYQYFRYKNIVTVFSLSKINLKSIQLPADVLNLSSVAARPREEYLDEIKDLYEKGLSLFSSLVERLTSLKSINLNEKQLQKLEQYIGQITTDQTLKGKIERINLLLTNHQPSLGPGDVVIGENEPKRIDYDLIDMLMIDLRKYLAGSVLQWNTRMNEFFKKTKLDDVAAESSIHSQPIEIPKGTSGASLRHPTVSNQASSRDEDSLLGKSLTNYGNGEPTESLLPHETGLSKSSSSSSNQPGAVSEQPAQTNQFDNILDDHSKTVSAISIGKRLFANLIPSTAFQPLKLPFADDEHYLLSSESVFYINDRHLTSIAAFTLSSKEYKDFVQVVSKMDLAKLNQQASISIHTSPLTNKDANLNLISSALQDTDEFDSVSTASGSTAALSNISGVGKVPYGAHFELQFHDSTTKFYCKIYYAELFRRLRKLVIPNEEDQFVHSLFRCVNWEAKGGKSNSQFRKTLDNRFVIKEMSRQEVQSFLEFAPDYIQYVSDSMQNKKPTALAKILGAFRICLMKNTTISSKAVKIDVIVMENLFYGKKKSLQVFDLKGSERNRLVNVSQSGGGTGGGGAGPSSASGGSTSYTGGKETDGNKDLVLLDENFLRWSFDNPIYVRTHTKHVLMKAIENDSKFLSSKFVMDYSLLTGIDMDTQEVSVGIIDYLRVFTWDKKVETYIKTIGGQGKMPTIVSPEVYRTRFKNAIDRYFLEVPDQWYTVLDQINE